MGSSRSRTRTALGVAALGLAALGAGEGEGAVTPPAAQERSPIVELWARGTATFGVFVPDERPRPASNRAGSADRGRRAAPRYSVEGAERLARNPLYDFVFLNLEGGYDADAVAVIAEGLRRAVGGNRKALLVRIPPLERAGTELTRSRVREVLGRGADGVVFPHIRSPEEARTAVGLMAGAGASLWSPSSPDGDKIAMIMIEDPVALARVEEIAEVPGVGILACGIGSLTAALDGDRTAAEAGNQRVLAEATRIGVADMITAGAHDVARRVEEGFLALLMRGEGADEAIRIGRAAAGR